MLDFFLLISFISMTLAYRVRELNELKLCVTLSNHKIRKFLENKTYYPIDNCF